MTTIDIIILTAKEFDVHPDWLVNSRYSRHCSPRNIAITLAVKLSDDPLDRIADTFDLTPKALKSVASRTCDALASDPGACLHFDRIADTILSSSSHRP